MAGAQLRKLDLSDNPMTAEVASALAHTIAGQPQLRALILNDISLMDEGIGPILEALVEGAPDLEELELALNEITQEGVKVRQTLILALIYLLKTAHHHLDVQFPTQVYLGHF